MGTNTAESTSAIPMTGPLSSCIALRAASLGVKPCSMWCCMPSTTTMASSTTRPIASTNPNNERVLTENPNNGKTAKVATSETGTANIGIRVARQSCRKM